MTIESKVLNQFQRSWYHSFLEEVFLSDKMKILMIFKLESIENPRFCFFWDTRYSVNSSFYILHRLHSNIYMYSSKGIYDRCIFVTIWSIKKKSVSLTPCSRILSVIHLSSLRYSLRDARHARSMTKRKGVALRSVERALRSWATSKIRESLVWSPSPLMYQSAMECITIWRMVGDCPCINNIMGREHSNIYCNLWQNTNERRP